jgi:hypothetical protein
MAVCKRFFGFFYQYASPMGFLMKNKSVGLAHWNTFLNVGYSHTASKFKVFRPFSRVRKGLKTLHFKVSRPEGRGN